MNIWIQSHNFEAIDNENISIEDAIHAFQEHDWNKELNDFEESKEEKCYPGLGLVSENGILHICPNKFNKNKVFYHYSDKKKVLGFIPIISEKTHEIESVSNNKIMKLIEYHYLNQQNKILKEK